MSKTMLINVTHAEESRVGIIADGVLASFEIETFSRQHLKGNIYKGVVHRIHPALEAAFVDIGAERDAFLPLDEICFRNLATPPPREVGNGSDGRRRPRIKEVLKPGEEVLVQIVKEEFASKPPTLSTFYSLPGRYLVLLPGSDEAGISRRIEGTERTRIRELIEKLQPPQGFGIIVRTAAGFDEGSRELHRDLSYLLRLWETIKQAATSKRAPALIYREHDLVLRNIRDYFTPDIDEIYIDNEEVCQRAREFLRDVMPGKEHVLHLYQGDQPIFSHFNVESQIESIYKRRVPLPSGGSIVVDGTEALTAIDVNSGRSVRGANQEETAVRTNVEAATEIARQLRLRDLGGLIVIDFIDMRNAQHVAEVEKTLRDAMRQDKARHDIGRISHFGLLEVSRQRLRPAAAATSYTACPMCEGHGLVRTTESAALVALRKVHNRIAQGDVMTLKVSLPPDVAIYLLNQKRDDVAQLERRYATRIQVVLNAALMPHQSEFEARARVEASQPEVPQIRLGGVTPSEPIAETAAAGNGSAAPAASVPGQPAAGPAGAVAGKRRRRRRGRRRGRGRQAAAAIGEALAALAAGTSLVQGGDDEATALAADREAAPAEVPEQIEAANLGTNVDDITSERAVDTTPDGPHEIVSVGDSTAGATRKPGRRRTRGAGASLPAKRRAGSRGRKKAASQEGAGAAVPSDDQAKAKPRKSTRTRKTAASARRRRVKASPTSAKSERPTPDTDAG
jgi:ribonuclease E